MRGLFCSFFRTLLNVSSDHWFLALVYKPGHMLRGDQSYIFTLDSYAPHAATRHAGVVQLLGTYLRKEYSRVTDGIPPQDFTEPVSKMVPVRIFKYSYIIHSPISTGSVTTEPL